MRLGCETICSVASTLDGQRSQFPVNWRSARRISGSTLRPASNYSYRADYHFFHRDFGSTLGGILFSDAGSVDRCQLGAV
jgi:hypothetical protein